MCVCPVYKLYYFLHFSYLKQVMQYFPEGNFILKRTNSCYYTGPGMDVRNSLPGEFRSAAETILTWHMTDNIMNKLEELNPILLHTFRGNIILSKHMCVSTNIFIGIRIYFQKWKRE